MNPSLEKGGSLRARLLTPWDPASGDVRWLIQDRIDAAIEIERLEYERAETKRALVGLQDAAFLAVATIKQQREEIERLSNALSEATAWTDEDKPLPEDDAIKAAHPLKTGDYGTHSEAMRLVGAKRSKHALVDLVNWLLTQRRPQ